MDFTNNTYIIIGICLGGCFIVPLIIAFFLPFIPTTPLDFLGFLRFKEFDRQEKERKDMVAVLQERGVTAPADVFNITFTGRSTTKSEWYSGIPPKVREYRYSVNVLPGTGKSFKAEFLQYMDDVNDEFGNLPGKIIVLYDPLDPSKMMFHSLSNDGTNERRAEFKRLMDMNDHIRKVGKEATAIIIKAEDLGLDYPSETGRAKRFLLKVDPASGESFNSETHTIVVYNSLEKYSEGKKIFVRYIPDKLERVAFDREKNKLIS